MDPSSVPEHYGTTKMIAFIGVAIVLVLIAYGYYRDYKDNKSGRH